MLLGLVLTFHWIIAGVIYFVLKDEVFKQDSEGQLWNIIGKKVKKGWEAVCEVFN